MAGAPVFAQNAGAEAETEAEEEEEEQGEEEQSSSAAADTIVVTGSRIRRDAFTSTAPLQVIDVEEIRDAGLIDTAQILQETTVAQGIQIDQTLSTTGGFVTDAGPGGNTITLRGISADQTLVLINGRRFAPAGVEGAPSLPNVNLIPSSMVQRVDILLDGASSVYGSDAVAGVVNVILRDQFQGLQVDGFVSVPEQSGGGSQRWNVMIGDSTERSSYVFATEYLSQMVMENQDRDWAQDAGSGLYCSRDLSYDAEGNLLSRCQGSIINRIRIYPGVVGGVLNLPVALRYFAVGLYGADVYRGIDDPSGLLAGTGFGAADGTLSNDPRFRSSYLLAGDDIIPHSQRYSLFFAGDRQLEPLFGMEGVTAFVEASHSNSQNSVKHTWHGQLFPTVPASNPFNLFGFDVVPIVVMPVERSNNTVEIQQTRILTGLEGDLAVLGAPSWTWEAFAGYTRSIGYSSRPGIDEARLRLSLYTSRVNPATGEIVCGIDIPAERFGFIDPDNCVPVNLFASSLYPNDGQSPVALSTQEERDYLELVRTVTTTVDQKIAGFFATGPVLQLPAGDLSAALGMEWREDGLHSGVDTVAAQGRSAGFFADRLSRGSVSLFETYGEISIPVLSGHRFAHDLALDLAGRLTNHEFYGQNSTYSVRGSWSPTESLTFRGTYGTSFRAPNVRELFLGGQTGFVSGAVDPCVVPFSANVNGAYVADEDNRDPQVIANCQAEGVDPFSLGLTGVPSIEAFRAGNTGLDPETSDARSAGFVFEQPFTDRFDFALGVSWFEINVEDSIAIPGAAFSLSRCYTSADFPNDPFCARRGRDPNTGLLSFVDNTPFNVSIQSTGGVDLNTRFNTEAPEHIFGGFDLGVSTVWTWTKDVLSQTTAESTTFNQVGDWGNPEWRGTINTRISKGDWSMLWRARYLGEQASIYNDATPDSRFPHGQRVYAACEQEGCVEEDSRDTPFRDYSSVITSADAVIYHDLSLTYRASDWIVRAGVNNVLDEDPALVDQDASGTSQNINAVLGAGYDLVGRRLFVNVTKRF